MLGRSIRHSHPTTSRQLIAIVNVVPALLTSIIVRPASSSSSSHTKSSQLNQDPRHSAQFFQYYGSKTGYFVGAYDHYFDPRTSSPSHLYPNWEKLVPSVDEGLAKCSLVHVNAVIRHGTRAPSAKDLKKVQNVINRLNEFSDRISHDHLMKSLLSWQSRFANQKEILPTGIREMAFLGGFFADMLKSPLVADSFEVSFRSSSVSRCIKSAQAFRDQFEGHISKTQQHPVTIDGKIDINDRLMRFFDTCQRYIDEVEGNPESKNEFERLKKSKMAKEWSQAYHSRFNLPAETLSFGEMLSVWKVAGIELAEFDNSLLQPLFDQERDVKFLEFLDDVEEYWQKLYGYRINYEMAYPLLAEIIGKFHTVTSEYGAKPSAVFNFGHAETVLPLIASFGLFKDDDHLTLETAHKYAESRRFQSSKVVPFGANIAFLIYNCAFKERTNPEFFFQVLVNGKPMPLFLETSVDNSKTTQRRDVEKTFSAYNMYPIDDVSLHLTKSIMSEDQCQANSFVPLLLFFQDAAATNLTTTFMTTVLSVWGIYRLANRFRHAR